MSESYKRLVIDPRALKPFFKVFDNKIYLDATEAINNAIDHQYTTSSEKHVLYTLREVVQKNQYTTK